jgi:hypothetical protein
MKKHGDTEARRKKDEGEVMMEEKEETSLQFHPSYFLILGLW